MAYKVIKQFKDKEDNNKMYEMGDEYPKGNFKPTKKRIDELSQLHPHYKAIFIEEVKKPEAKKQAKDSNNKE